MTYTLHHADAGPGEGRHENPPLPSMGEGRGGG